MSIMIAPFHSLEVLAPEVHAIDVTTIDLGRSPISLISVVLVYCFDFAKSIILALAPGRKRNEIK